jgi:type VI secretion system protein VasD
MYMRYLTMDFYYNIAIVLRSIPSRQMAAICALGLLSACTLGPKTYEIRGNGDSLLNRDVGGQSLSVVVRIIQLRDAEEYSKLTFDMIASGRTDSELLGPDLISKTEVVIVPGGKYSNTDKLENETKYLGVIALFRRPDQHYWRYLVSANAVRDNGLSFAVKDCYLTLIHTRSIAIPGQPQDAKPECNATQALHQGQGGPNSTQPTQPIGRPSQGYHKHSGVPKKPPPPTVNVGIQNSVAPASTSIESDGVNSINIGGTSASPAALDPNR